jgi:histidyl-tRNA synthetase
MNDLGYSRNIAFVPSLARGHDYYTGMIFEAVCINSNNKSTGTVVGGGRYDNLIGILAGSNE